MFVCVFPEYYVQCISAYSFLSLAIVPCNALCSDWIEGEDEREKRYNGWERSKEREGRERKRERERKIGKKRGRKERG